MLDVDGDGDLDVLRGKGYHPNDGSGVFGAFVPLFSGSFMGSGDMEGDGDTDLVTQDGADLAWQRNDGLGAFVQVPITAASGNTGMVAVGDLDLAEPVPGAPGSLHGNAIDVWENLGGGAYALRAAQDTGLENKSVQMKLLHALDVDGDGSLDLLGVTDLAGSSSKDEVLAVFRGTGSGIAFHPAAYFPGQAGLGLFDVDQDGDLDAAGNVRAHARRFHGPQDGALRQHGSGTPGTGGAIPLLGARGPLRPGTSGAAITLRNGLGGALLAIGYGLFPGNNPDLPFPGATLYLNPPFSFVIVPLGGAPGVAGAGQLDLPLGGATLAAFAGLTFTLQAATLDAGVGPGIAMSNALELTLGL